MPALFLALACLVGLVSAECGSPGLDTLCDSLESWGSPTAQATTSCTATFYQAGLRGSFIAKQTGDHAFHLTEALSGSAIGQAGWSWDLGESELFSGSVTHAYSCFAKYRYALMLHVIVGGLGASTSTLTISVQYPGSSEFSLLGGNNCETCYESGCRDTTGSREPFHCMPAPTAPMPTLTASHSPGASVFQTGTATAAAST
jgi:hypothetical protein